MPHDLGDGGPLRVRARSYVACGAGAEVPRRIGAPDSGEEATDVLCFGGGGEGKPLF